MKNWDKKANGPKKVNWCGFFCRNLLEADFLLFFLSSFQVAFTVYLRNVYKINSTEEVFHPLIDFCFDWIDDGALKKVEEDKASYWTGGYELKVPSIHILNFVGKPLQKFLNF